MTTTNAHEHSRTEAWLKLAPAAASSFKASSFPAPAAALAAVKPHCDGQTSGSKADAWHSKQHLASTMHTSSSSSVLPPLASSFSRPTRSPHAAATHTAPLGAGRCKKTGSLAASTEGRSARNGETRVEHAKEDVSESREGENGANTEAEDADSEAFITGDVSPGGGAGVSARGKDAMAARRLSATSRFFSRTATSSAVSPFCGKHKGPDGMGS